MSLMPDTTLPTDPPAPAGNPAYVSIPLRNDPGLISILGSMLGWVGADGAKAWQAPATFHCSLCWVPDVDDKTLKKVIAQLETRSVDLESAGLNVFATPSGYALHLSLKRTDGLMALQASVYAAFEAAGIEVSPRHAPETFNPHVTLGYFEENPVQRIDTFWWARRTSALEVSREGYKTVALLGDETPSWRFIDRFSLVNPDDWFCIVPVGAFQRFGRSVKVTVEMLQEMLRNFGRIPDHTLPVNREHEETLGKVGSIAALEMRSDGLYARGAWLPDWVQSVADGAFQYFSPEIVWGPTDYDGQIVSNVLVGLGLTNGPYFGSETALYSLQDFVNSGGAATGSTPEIESFEGGSPLSDIKTTKEVIREVVEDVLSKHSSATPPPAPAQPVESEEFRAVRSENAQLKQDIDALRTQQAENARTARVAKFNTLLGAGFEAQAAKFAAIEDEAVALQLAEDFKALKAQNDPALFGELGSATPADQSVSSAEKYHAEAERVAKDRKLDLADAYELVANEHPEWAKAAQRKYSKRSDD